MSVFGIGVSYGVATLVAMFSGMPIAFALGAVAVVFMAIYMPAASLDTVTQNVYEEMASITLLSIPYGLMALGMTLLCVQILLQVVMPLTGAARR